VAKLETLVDDFNDNSINGTLWGVSTSGSASVGESGGQLSLVANAGTTLATFYSQQNYDLTDSFIRFKVNSVAPGGDFSALSEFYLAANVGDYRIHVRVQANNLIFFYTDVNGIRNDIWSSAWNATTYRYWRIRELGGVKYFDTSSDGSSWTNRASTTVNGASFSNASPVWSAVGSASAGVTFSIDDANVYTATIFTQESSLGLNSDEIDMTPPVVGGAGGFLFGGWGMALPGASYYGSAPLISESVIIVDSGYHYLYSDEATLVQDVYLSPDEASLGHTAEQANIIQSLLLVVQDALVGHTVDSTNIIQDHSLAVQDALSTLTVDHTTLTQLHNLIASDANIALASDSVNYVANIYVVPSDSDFNIASDPGDFVYELYFAPDEAGVGLKANTTTIVLQLTPAGQDGGVYQPGQDSTGAISPEEDIDSGVYQPRNKDRGTIEATENSTGSWIAL